VLVLEGFQNQEFYKICLALSIQNRVAFTIFGPISPSQDGIIKIK